MPQIAASIERIPFRMSLLPAFLLPLVGTAGMYGYIYVPPPLFLGNTGYVRELPLDTIDYDRFWADSIGAKILSGDDTLGLLVGKGFEAAPGDSLAPGENHLPEPTTAGRGWATAGVKKTPRGDWYSELATALYATFDDNSGDEHVYMSFGPNGSGVFDTLPVADVRLLLERPIQNRSRFGVVVLGKPIQIARRLRGSSDSTVRVRDVLLPWGLWLPGTGRWVAGGRVPLRRELTSVGRIEPDDAASTLFHAIVDSFPKPFDGPSRESLADRHYWGGLLIGGSFRLGKESEGTLSTGLGTGRMSIDDGGIALNIAWFPSTWGVGILVPIYSRVNASRTTRVVNDPYVGDHEPETKSVQIFTQFAPTIEGAKIIPLGKWGLTLGLGGGPMWLTGSSTGWVESPPKAFGWVYHGRVGLYRPGKLVYFESDVGLEQQNFLLAGLKCSESVLVVNLQVGFRTNRD